MRRLGGTHLCSMARLLVMSNLLRIALPWTPPPCRAPSLSTVHPVHRLGELCRPGKVCEALQSRHWQKDAPGKGDIQAFSSASWKDSCLGPSVSDWGVQLLKFAEEGVIHAERFCDRFPCISAAAELKAR